MPALVAGIHVLNAYAKVVDGRDIGERSDAVLWTAMPGHDGREFARRHMIGYCPAAALTAPPLDFWT